MKSRFTKSKYKNNWLNRKFYKDWKKANPKWKNIKFIKFNRILRDILKGYQVAILTEPYEVKFGTLGTIAIQFVEKRKPTLNFKLTQEVKEDIEFLNFGTNGKVAKITWNVDVAHRGNKYLKLMGFEPNSHLKKQASKIISQYPELLKHAKF